MDCDQPDHPDDGRVVLLDDYSPSEIGPSEATCHRELSRLLILILSNLPESEAEVLRLYHGEGLSFEAIGRRQGVSQESARTTWARGLKALRCHIPLD